MSSRFTIHAARAAAAALVLAGTATGVALQTAPAAAAPASAVSATVAKPVALGPANLSPGAATNSVGYDFYAGYLNGGATGRYCFSFNNRALVGPVVVSAGATSANIIMTTVSTDLENRLNYGWVYCATIRNASASGSGLNLYTRASL